MVHRIATEENFCTEKKLLRHIWTPPASQACFSLFRLIGTDRAWLPVGGMSRFQVVEMREEDLLAYSRALSGALLLAPAQHEFRGGPGAEWSFSLMLTDSVEVN